MNDILFSTLEEWHGKGASWGDVLDAGTGVHSLRWLQTLNTSSWTAITADNAMKETIESSYYVTRRSQDKVIVGNWMNDAFNDSLGKFDVILADYLIGAVDGFSPYCQDIILDRLKQHLNPGGKIYIVGMNPIPDCEVSPGCIVSEVRRLRDACILLAGHRPYREYPIEWITRHLQKSSLRVVHTKSYSILHSEESLLRQINVAEQKLPLMSEELRNSMRREIDVVKQRVRNMCREASNNRIPLSFDYCIVAELIS